MSSSRRRTRIPGGCLASLWVVLCISCSSGNRTVVDGVLAFDEEVALVRGEKVDRAKRSFRVDADATFVAIVNEDDTSVIVTMSHAGTKSAAAGSIQVDSVMEGEGFEVAVLDAPRGSELTLSLEGTQGFDRPGKVRVRVLRYDAEVSTVARVAARISALRAWSAATESRISGDDLRNSAMRDIDRALAHFESSEGDTSMAAWGRMVRSRLNYRQLTDLNGSLLDAERAERGFTEIGAKRNAGRARFQQAYALVEIAHDKAAKDPGPEEAAERARQILIDLGNEPAMSALERARAMNLRGVLAFHVYDLAESRARLLEAIPAYEAIGNHSERLRTLGNIGAIAVEQGDYRGATRYYDQVIAELYRFESALTHAKDAPAPFLIMHGTADPTVSFSEGMNFYNALRYNNKSAVMLAYPGEGHGLRGMANRKDLTIRYFEFFDHYLKGAPAPKWMTEGVPFLKKK